MAKQQRDDMRFAAVRPPTMDELQRQYQKTLDYKLHQKDNEQLNMSRAITAPSSSLMMKPELRSKSSERTTAISVMRPQ